MKKLYIALCVIALSVLLAACDEDSKMPAVAVVNAAKVQTECEAGKQAKEYLDKIVADMQKDLFALQKTVENAPQNQRAVAQEKYQATLLDYQQRARAEEQQILSKLSVDYQSAVDEYRKANNISLVLRSEVIISTSPEADITQAIIDTMNKNTEAENKAALEAANKSTAPEANAEVPANATSEEEAVVTANATQE